MACASDWLLLHGKERGGSWVESFLGTFRQAIETPFVSETSRNCNIYDQYIIRKSSMLGNTEGINKEKGEAKPFRSLSLSNSVQVCGSAASFQLRQYYI